MASSPAVLKQQAAALELKKQPEKALALYQQLLDEHGGSEDVDVSLRNRVGDLHLRLGQIDEAIQLFERSADEYALSGFLNNGIALCNKILRQRPGHVSTLRRLARFSAEKGMVVDAQRHYLSVAEALERLGQHGEALQALSEFAELSPDDVHVRSVVIEQLLRADRRADALPHLSVLHHLHAIAGRSEEADEVARVARDIDPGWVAAAEEARAGKRAKHSLILIDSDDDFGALETSPMPGAEPEAPAPTASLEGLEFTAPTEQGLDDLSISEALVGFEATSFEPPDTEPDAADSLLIDLLFDVVPPLVPQSATDGPEFIEFLDIDFAPHTLPVVDIPFADVALELPEPYGTPSSVLDPLPPEPLPLESAFGTFGDMPLGTMSDTLPGMSTDGLFEMSEHAMPASLSEPLSGLSDFTEPLPGLSDFSATPQDDELEHTLLGSDVDFADSDAIEAAPVAPAPAPSVPVAAPEAVAPVAPPPREYVNLADNLRDDEALSARMTIGEPQQTGDHGADFQHILQEFRHGLEKSISVDDAESHYDLGIAFREMGLLDDAIAEFQTAARSVQKRVGSIEALGGCFLDKMQPGVARTVLQRALDDPAGTRSDEELRGVLYLLGRASEELGARDDGLRYYQRVYAVDIRFRDVAVRIQNLQQPA